MRLSMWFSFFFGLLFFLNSFLLASDPRCPSHLRGRVAQPLGPIQASGRSDHSEVQASKKSEPKPLFLSLFKIEGAEPEWDRNDSQFQYKMRDRTHRERAVFFQMVYLRKSKARAAIDLKIASRTLDLAVTNLRAVFEGRRIENLRRPTQDLRFFLMSNELYKDEVLRRSRTEDPLKVFQDLQPRDRKILFDRYVRRMPLKEMAKKYVYDPGTVSRKISRMVEEIGLNPYLLDWEEVERLVLTSPP